MAIAISTCESTPLLQKRQVVSSWRSKSLRVSQAAAGSESEVLTALSVPSLTNVIMAGFVRDNTTVSPSNRGRFYVCRSERDEIKGVALIGHSVLFEAFSEGAIAAFAAVARCEAPPHLLMGHRNAVQRFWHYYAGEGQVPRHVCPILFLRRAPFEEKQPVSGLRLAAREDLEHVVRAQAAMALEISGVDPLAKDPIGFRERYLHRIEKNRVWVLIENGRLVFKTDVIAETPEAIYIEGVYVSPEERGKGIGQRCLTAVGHSFRGLTNAIYLFVENEDARIQSFYRKLGFNVAAQYDLLYF